MDISSINMYTSYITDQASTSETQSALTADKNYANSTDEELMDVCKQFEAYFLEQVFKQMMKTVPESEESSGANSALVDYFKDNMIQELASQSTETNSLGIAQTLYEQMKRNYSV